MHSLRTGRQVDLTLEDIADLERLRDDRVERRDLKRKARRRHQTVKDHETRLSYTENVLSELVKEHQNLIQLAKEGDHSRVVEKTEKIFPRLVSAWMATIIEDEREDDVLLTTGEQAMDKLGERVADTFPNS